MNDENTKIEDARTVSPELVAQQRKDPGFGPGNINLAVPDRGHIPSCLGQEFDSMAAFNDFCSAHPDWLAVFVGTRGDKVAVIFQVLKNENSIEEMRLASQFAEEKMAEFRQKREEQAALAAKTEAEAKAADDACRRIGRLCIEKHGAFVEALPGLSKIKVTRKSIADDLVLRANELVKELSNDPDAQVKAMAKLLGVLNKYVKEGV